MIGGGALASLEAIADGRRGRILEHLAVLAPERVTGRLSTLIEESSDEELESAVPARRPLVWALQKLVWHSATFEEAADSLLRLAITENESYSNNATGEWTGLFATILPSTAALPSARLNYLRTTAGSPDKRIRLTVVKAARSALSLSSSTVVSGELQGGVIVEPRGKPATWQEAWDYQSSMIGLLRQLIDDPDADVAAAALGALIESIQACLEIDDVRQHLISALRTLKPDQLRLARTQLSELDALYERADTDSERDVLMAEAVAAVLDGLPEEAPRDRLWRILHRNSWDRTSDQIEEEISEVFLDMTDEDRQAVLLAALTEEIPTDFTVGHMLSIEPSDSVAAALTTHLGGPNSRALPGYLFGLEERERGTFDRFVDELNVQAKDKLRLTAQGPRTDRASERVVELLPELPVADGARAIFFWARDTSDESLLRRCLSDWVQRIEDQDDYNAVVDFLRYSSISGRMRLRNWRTSSPLLLQCGQGS